MTTPRDCSCCEGISVKTPIAIANRPGLPALKYRIGTHATFFESLIAQLSIAGLLPRAPGTATNSNAISGVSRNGRNLAEGAVPEHLLRNLLTTRDKSDPAIALLDSWAIVADLLTFYQERLANEGFLRTAQERRSLDELSRLVGYQVRPGVSATVLLAFTIDDNFRDEEVEIPVGTSTKSTPRPGSNEQPQTFETSRNLIARKEWNVLRPRKTRPQLLTPMGLSNATELYFEGTGLRLVPNDLLAVHFGYDTPPEPVRVLAVIENQEQRLTIVKIAEQALSLRAMQKTAEDLHAALLGCVRSQFLSDELRAELEHYLKCFKDFATRLLETASIVDVDTWLAQELLYLFGIEAGLADRHEQQAVTLCNLTKKMQDALAEVQILAKTITSGMQRAAFDSFALGIQGLVDKHQAALNVLSDLRIELLRSPGSKESADVEIRRALLRMSAVFQNTSADDTPVLGVISKTREFPTSATPTPVSFLVRVPTLTTASVTGLLRWQIKTRLLSSPRLPDSKLSAANVTETLSETSGRTVSASGTELTFLLLANSNDASVELTSTAALPDGFYDLRVSLRLFDELDPGNPSLRNADEQMVRFQVNSASLAGSLPRIELTKDLSNPIFDSNEFVAKIGAGINITDQSIIEDGSQCLVRILHSVDGLQLVDGKSLRDPDITRLALDFRKTSAVSTGDFVDAIKAVQLVATNAVAVRLVDIEFTLYPVVGSAEGQPSTVICHVVVPPAQNGYDRLCQSIVDLDNAVHEQAAFPPPQQAGVVLLLNGLQPFVDVLSNIRIGLDPDFEELKNIGSMLLANLDPSAFGGASLVPELDSIAKVIADGIKLILQQSEFHQIALSYGVNYGCVESDILSKEACAAFKQDGVQVLRKEPRYSTVGLELDVLTALMPRVDELCATLTQAMVRRYLTALDVKDRAALAALRRLNASRREFLDKVKRVVQRQNSSAEKLPNSESLITALDDLQKAYIDADNCQLPDLLADATNASSAGQICASKLDVPFLADLVCWIQAIWRREIDALATCNLGKPQGTQVNEIDARVPPLQSLVKFVKEPRKKAVPKEAIGGKGNLDNALQEFSNLIASSGAARARREHVLGTLFAENSDLVPLLFTSLKRGDASLLRELIRSHSSRDVPQPRVEVFRSQARLFGWNVPKKVPSATATSPPTVIMVDSFEFLNINENSKGLFLDGRYQRIVRNDYVALLGTDSSLPEYSIVPQLHRVLSAETHPRTAYGISGDTTELEFTTGWWSPEIVIPRFVTPFGPVVFDPNPRAIQAIQFLKVFCEVEELPLAEEPFARDGLLPTDGDEQSFAQIVLDDVYLGLSLEKTLLLEGVPSNCEFKPSLPGSPPPVDTVVETLSVGRIEHQIDRDLYGDRFRTVLHLTQPLAKVYHRESVRIFANVVEATHGETQREVLGSGDGAREFPEFELKKPEVSQLPAPTPTGIVAAMTVRVNDVKWTEGETFKDARSSSREYIARIDNRGQTLVQFGDGENGTRLPTGRENVRAVYRTGLGIKGNVASGQISQVVGAPLGVKGVINPLAARDGTDPEPADLARIHVPLAVSAMERLVSVQDFADFARCFAGIGEATAGMMQRTVRVTVTGMTAEPLQVDGPVLRNLHQAYAQFGDPSQRFALHVREAVLLILQARVRIAPDREWEKVEPEIRKAVLATFGYDCAKFGRDLLLSDAFTAIQNMDGVVYVDIEVFDSVGEGETKRLADILKNPQLRQRIVVQPARITSDREEIESRGVVTCANASRRDCESEATPVTVSLSTEADRSSVDENAPRFRAAQLAFISAEIPDTLVLEQIR